VLGGDRNSSEIEAIFIRLVRLGDTGGATRRLARRREFSDQRWAMLQTLADEEGNRLVLISGAEGDERAEIAHEALVTQWPRFQRWLQAGAGDKRTLDELIERAARWAPHEIARESLWKRALDTLRPPYEIDQDRKKTLAMGVEREAFSQLADTHRKWLSDVETAFVAESDREHESKSRAARTRARWTRMMAGAFAVFFMMATGLAWWGNELRREANQQFEDWKGRYLELSKDQQEMSQQLNDADEEVKKLLEAIAIKKEVEAAAIAIKKEAEAAKQEALDKLRAIGLQ
jgi:hypothetical protein